MFPYSGGPCDRDKGKQQSKCERGWVIASLETQAWLMESKSQNSLLNRHDEFS